MKIKVKEYLIIFAALLFVFAVYLSTMNPVFKNNDSPETSTAAYTLGIGHPPGYPLHAVMGKLFTLPGLATPAFRMNLFSSFLACMILILTYFIIKNLFIKVFGVPNYPYLAGSVAVIAFSYIFWNQGIEAKGGIYMLNLLFLCILVLTGLKLFEKFSLKYIYLTFFIYGLSMANHWPSMVILAPVIFAAAIVYYRRLKAAGLLFSILFFILGLTPYLYLVIRASGNAVLNWGDPSNLSNFLWVVFRKAYSGPVKASAEVFKYQAKEFSGLFFSNFGLLWVFIPAGIYAVFRKSVKIAAYITAMALTVILVVVFYNRSQEGVKWLLQIFLLPAEYLFGLLLAVGAVHVIFAVRIKWLRVCLSFIIAVYAAYMVFENYTRNDHSRDYLSYDYGNNILATIEPKGVFIGDGDYNLMPVYYIRQMQKKRTDIVFAAGSFLIFDWGIRDFQEKYGNIPMKPYRAEDNIKNIVEAYADGGHVYRSRFMPRMDKLPAAYIMSDKGILISVASKKKVFSPAIYSLYSYRGLFEKFTLEEKNNRDMTGWYPVSMVNQANTLLAEGYPDQAEMLYKRSLLFPVDKPEGNILYNLALACAGQNNTDDELKYLLAAAKKNCSFPAAYERAGIILYNKGMLVEAKDMFVSAAGQGSLSAESGRALEYINSLKTNEAYEVAMIKANNSLLNNDYGHAEELYKYLLEKRYKVAIINRNIGVFHFRTQKYDLAIESFEKSNNDTQDPVTYKYLALTYYKTGRINEALKTVDDGIKIFQNEKQLEQLEVQIKGEINKNEKNSSGTDR